MSLFLIFSNELDGCAMPNNFNFIPSVAPPRSDVTIYEKCNESIC